TIPHIYFSDYGKLKIYIPDFSEQQKIGQFFSSIDYLIQSQKLKLKKLNEVKQSFLSKMFASENPKFPEIRFKGFKEEWNNSSLFRLATVVTGGEPPKYYSENINYSKNFIYPIYSNGFGENALWGYSNSYKITAPSITFSSIGTLGYPTIRTKPYTPIIRLKVIIPISGMVELSFLKYALDQSDFLQNSSGIPNINAEQVKNIIIKYTNLNEQQKIGAFFSNLDSLISSQELKLEKLNNIKQALLKKCFVSYFEY
ncbi:restriction endonuclease subunit S, partial [Mycoplasma sp. AA7A]|uniref:restriction endonuclease subunit S n=1 Tax=Mycoplasma sp. AA7A TaxID=3401665 RepID=UPI003AAA3944